MTSFHLENFKRVNNRTNKKKRDLSRKSTEDKRINEDPEFVLEEFRAVSLGLLCRDSRLQLEFVLQCESLGAFESHSQLPVAESGQIATDLRSRCISVDVDALTM